MFFLFTLAFALYAVFLMLLVYDKKVVEQDSLREIFGDAGTLLLDFIVILSVMSLHRKTLKEDPEDRTERHSAIKEQRKESKQYHLSPGHNHIHGILIEYVLYMVQSTPNVN
jgi:ABC-type nickel/cobalt efflux system permease component RcnA